jgi:DNA repair protein RecO (recombination protein O)
MIHNVRALVLWSRRSRDADKIVGLYTAEKGRLTARATSAARAGAKFTALTEPFVESELAVYMRPAQAWGKIVGGRICQTFPNLRTQVERSTAASWACEVVYRLTPEEQPSIEKFSLLKEALTALETVPCFRILRLAFALRFLGIAGFGVGNREPWQRLKNHRSEWSARLLQDPLYLLGEEDWSDPLISSLERLAGDLVNDHLLRPLQVNRFRQMTGINI